MHIFCIFVFFLLIFLRGFDRVLLACRLICSTGSQNSCFVWHNNCIYYYLFITKRNKYYSELNLLWWPPPLFHFALVQNQSLNSIRFDLNKNTWTLYIHKCMYRNIWVDTWDATVRFLILYCFWVYTEKLLRAKYVKFRISGFFKRPINENIAYFIMFLKHLNFRETLHKLQIW